MDAEGQSLLRQAGDITLISRVRVAIYSCVRLAVVKRVEIRLLVHTRLITSGSPRPFLCWGVFVWCRADLLPSHYSTLSSTQVKKPGERRVSYINTVFNWKVMVDMTASRIWARAHHLMIKYHCACKHHSRLDHLPCKQLTWNHQLEWLKLKRHHSIHAHQANVIFIWSWNRTVQSPIDHYYAIYIHFLPLGGHQNLYLPFFWLYPQ